MLHAMSKLNQIQQALLELGGGEFQKLADAYLAEKGYGRINAIGSDHVPSAGYVFVFIRTMFRSWVIRWTSPATSRRRSPHWRRTASTTPHCRRSSRTRSTTRASSAW